MTTPAEAATIPPGGRGLAAIHRVGVLGSGRMAAGIAEACARAGAVVTLCVDAPAAGRAEACRDEVVDALHRAFSEGGLTQRERAQAEGRVSARTGLDALAGCDLVVEALVEDEAVKCDALARLDAAVVDPHCVLASTTSSIPIAHLAAATGRPERVIGMHFFHPVATSPLVEVVSTPGTDPVAAARAAAFARDVLGCHVVDARDRPGFVVNSLLVPYLLGAVRMVESGVVTADEVDRAMTSGLGYPHGPLELADQLGLDTVEAVARSMYAESGQESLRPPEMLTELVAQGRTGRRTGSGFHRYDQQGRPVRE